MSRVLIAFYLLANILVANPVLASDSTEQEININPVHGPLTAELGGHGTIYVPEGFVFLNGDDVRELFRDSKQPIDYSEIGAVLAPKELGGFEVYFSFHPEGFIRDDEKDQLDSNQIMKALKAGNQKGNEERRRLGGNTLTLTGWQASPYFNDETKNLEWATNLRDDSDKHMIVNHNTRLLGRNGYVSSILVCSPSEYLDVIGSYQQTLAGFNFKPGERYADYRQGDKVAKYGLTALMTGGAAAVAAKTGLLKYLWKFIVGIGVAIAAGFSKIFGRKRT